MPLLLTRNCPAVARWEQTRLQSGFEEWSTRGDRRSRISKRCYRRSTARRIELALVQQSGIGLGLGLGARLSTAQHACMHSLRRASVQ